MWGLTASFTGIHTSSLCLSQGDFSCYLLMAPSLPASVLNTTLRRFLVFTPLSHTTLHANMFVPLDFNQKDTKPGLRSLVLNQFCSASSSYSKSISCQLSQLEHFYSCIICEWLSEAWTDHLYLTELTAGSWALHTQNATALTGTGCSRDAWKNPVKRNGTCFRLHIRSAWWVSVSI